MDLNAWNSGKRNHLQLANDAAATYDADYARSAYATRCYMAFEEHALRGAAADAAGHRLALDLGCGTGRLSQVLAERFDRVWGCDIAPEMVAQARRAAGPASNMTFAPLDVDKGPLPFNRNCADLVNAGFGMFSFVWDPARLVADVRRVLRPGGLFTISCYNAGVLSLPKETPWTPALNARVDVHGARVSHNGQTSQINAQGYSPPQLRHLLEPGFEVEAVVSLPTLAAVLPAHFVEDARVRALCAAIDLAVAFREDLAAGAYLWVRARKRGNPKRSDRSAGTGSRGRKPVRYAHKAPTFKAEPAH